MYRFNSTVILLTDPYANHAALLMRFLCFSISAGFV